MKIEHLFDKTTFTLTYLVYDETSKDAVIIDPVLDYDPAGGKITHESLNVLCDKIKSLGLKIKMILETHAHADHLSSSQDLKDLFPDAPLAIGENIKLVQKTFKPVFNMPESFITDGSQFDRLLKDGETVKCGTLEFSVIFTPGHTPACASYLFGKNLFTGDALFMPDSGTGRCDFPEGSAKNLYHSVHERLYKLPDDTLVHTAHDYQPGGREIRFCCPLKEQKEKNIQIQKETKEKDFIKRREERDKQLSAPRLLFPSVQVNINGGKLPEAENNGKTYLKTPVHLSSSLNS